MKFIKDIWNKIKEPKPLYIALFYIFFALIVGGTIAVLIFIPDQNAIHYILYAIAFVALCYFVYSIVYFAPKIKNNIIKILKKYKYTNAMLEDYGYRTIVFSTFSFLLNVAYIVFVGTFAIISRNAWYISMSAYYLCLSLMKGNVFYSMRKHNTEIKQARAYRYCGIIFICLAFVFSGLMTLIYAQNRVIKYAGVMIYVVAAYTFYKLTLAIYNIFKARKQDSLYVQSIRNINMVSALVSIVLLQVSMMQAFSQEHNQSIAHAFTGAGISIIILALAVFMIVKANKRLKEIKNEEQK